MSPALALAYWWDSLDQSTSFSNCNLFVATRPDKAIPEVLTIYDIDPARYGSVETKSIRHPRCRVSVRSSDYMTGWGIIEHFQSSIQAVEIYSQTVDEGYTFGLGHGTIRSGPTFRGSIPEENLELFTMTVSFQFGYTANL